MPEPFHLIMRNQDNSDVLINKGFADFEDMLEEFRITARFIGFIDGHGIVSMRVHVNVTLSEPVDS